MYLFMSESERESEARGKKEGSEDKTEGRAHVGVHLLAAPLPYLITTSVCMCDIYRLAPRLSIGRRVAGTSSACRRS